MALNNYSALKTAVGSWLARSDLSTAITDFITLAEAEFNRRLRTRNMETINSSFTIDGELVSLPSGLLEVRSFFIDSDPRRRLEYVTADVLAGIWGGSDTGTPTHYSIVGSQFRFAPAPDDDYTGNLTYYAEISALSDSNTTNWLLTSHPGAYLFGALRQAAPYIRDDERVALWEAKYEAEIASIERADSRKAFAGPLVIRPDIDIV